MSDENVTKLNGVACPHCGELIEANEVVAHDDVKEALKKAVVYRCNSCDSLHDTAQDAEECYANDDREPED